MGVWKKVWIGFKVALGVAIKLNEHKIIRVKELDAAREVVDVIESEIRDAKPQTPKP